MDGMDALVLVISDSGLPRRGAGLAVQRAREFRPSRSFSARRTRRAVSQGRLLWPSQRLALPCRRLVPSPASRHHPPAEQAAQGPRRQGQGRPPLFWLLTSRPSLASPSAVSPRPRA